MTPEEFMAEAIAISRKAVSNPAHRPFAAFIVKDGEIVGRGLNDTPSSHDPTAHGEVLAIRDATKRLGTQDLSECEIYTTCEPCSLCVAAIWWAGLDKMYYAATLKDCAEIGIGVSGLVEEIAKPVNSRKMKAEQIWAMNPAPCSRNGRSRPASQNSEVRFLKLGPVLILGPHFRTHCEA